MSIDNRIAAGAAEKRAANLRTKAANLRERIEVMRGWREKAIAEGESERAHMFHRDVQRLERELAEVGGVPVSSNGHAPSVALGAPKLDLWRKANAKLRKEAGKPGNDSETANDGAATKLVTVRRHGTLSRR